ncbi:hypothetical protein BDR07DRAFT_1405490, partial [Suillus spraguei]
VTCHMSKFCDDLILTLVMIQITTILSSLFRGNVSYVANTKVLDIAIIEFASTYIMGPLISHVPRSSPSFVNHRIAC